jgi:hypothetical protein
MGLPGEVIQVRLSRARRNKTLWQALQSLFKAVLSTCDDVSNQIASWILKQAGNDSVVVRQRRRPDRHHRAGRQGGGQVEDCRVGEAVGKAGLPESRPETARALLATLADSGRQRPRYLVSLAAKPRNVKDNSERARKSELRRTAWWSWQDSNSRPSGYDAVRSRLAAQLTTAMPMGSCARAR